MAHSSPSSPSPPPIDTAPIAKGRLTVTPNLLNAEQIVALREDATALYSAGAFVPGGLRRRSGSDHGSAKDTKSNRKNSTERQANMKTTTDETMRVCDVCGLFDDAEKAPESVGNRRAREELFDLMADLRELLQIELDVELSEGMELQYLRYPGGRGEETSRNKRSNVDMKGFYGRHFDSSPEDAITCRRKISLLLYLNEAGWNPDTDGGTLRAYLRPKSRRKRGGDVPSHDRRSDEEIAVQDVIPEGGKLVLFDSKAVEHEVLRTRRERWAVVGWFLDSDGAARRKGGADDIERRKSNSPGKGRRRDKKRRRAR
ncbi:hypothetical protein ACHAWF_001124 [Thalassiosira exigua]